MSLHYRVMQTHSPHMAETVGLYLLVKDDVRSCECLLTSANPDCGVLDEDRERPRNITVRLCAAQEIFWRTRSLKKVLTHGQNFVCAGRGYMRPRERVVVREDARNDDGRQVKASSEC